MGGDAVSLTAVLFFRPTRLVADIVSAPCLVAVTEICRVWKKEFLAPYRPELHYMRGPGPKWREKHALAGPIPTMSCRS